MTKNALRHSDPKVDLSIGSHAQWRLAEVQIANWGTFDGAIHRIPIARRGHLITGPSGSGKSSLLDAIASVLTPSKWLRFNEAALSSPTKKDQRSPMSYVRGAWTRRPDELEDRLVSEYLRDKATWSGILLRYEQPGLAPLTLARLFFARGSKTSAADLADMRLLERSAIDLNDLQPFAKGGLEPRKAQNAWPDAVITSGDKHQKFFTRMRNVLGIESESALQLLHRTQSAKSLDSLDLLFREYMLERPATFSLAETAVEQFGELRDAHSHVVRLREQKNHLGQLVNVSYQYDTADAQAIAAAHLSAAVYPFQRRLRLDLAQTDIARKDELVATLRSQAELSAESLRHAQDAFDTAQQQTIVLGGANLDQLRRRIEDAENAAQTTLNRLSKFRDRLGTVGIARVPESGKEHAELIVQIGLTLAKDGAQLLAPTHEQLDRAAKAREIVQRLEREIDWLKRSGTSVPGQLLEIRGQLATHLGIPEIALPFAAELISVRDEYAEWTGAIERVLHGFALTLLVRSEHLALARRWADERHLGTRLDFEEVANYKGSLKPASSDVSLVNRLSVKPGPFEQWVKKVVSERFDFACVTNTDRMDEFPRALTVQGQIKSSATRYSKDDKYRVADRSRWVLGNIAAKHEGLVVQLSDAHAELAHAARVVSERDSAAREDRVRIGVFSVLQDSSWQEIDIAAAQQNVDRLKLELQTLSSGNSSLQEAIRARTEALTKRNQANKTNQIAQLDLQKLESSVVHLQSIIAETEKSISAEELPEPGAILTDQLRKRFLAKQRRVTVENISDVGQLVAIDLTQERDQHLQRANVAADKILRLATQFAERWKEATVDLVLTIEGRTGFIELHDRIVAHGLPEHEERFLTLLRDRSQDLIAQILSEILSGPREIEDRIAPVNTSLRRSKFDEDRFLRIKVKTRRSETVQRFIASLRSITEDGWSDDSPERAEERFATLSEIMRGLASSESTDRRWKDQCLDTRMHVTFLAEEIDRNDRVHAAYDSGAAMSGGQQQKLVVFCLAAALRYQLAHPDDPLPQYATIVLDEAFDKADSRYTRIALDVFVEFGFQMILATPQKLLQTIEPYVGAVTSIENPSRSLSLVSNLVWDTEIA